MKLLKNPIVNAFFLGLMSTVYSFLFIFTSNHIEFVRQLSRSETLNSVFWNSWSDFIKSGNMEYIGYLIIALTLFIFSMIIFKRVNKYDEYQANILSFSMIIAGLLSIIMIPFMMVLILSNANYAIETIFLFASVQWVSVLLVYLFYVVKY